MTIREAYFANSDLQYSKCMAQLYTYIILTDVYGDDIAVKVMTTMKLTLMA